MWYTLRGECTYRARATIDDPVEGKGVWDPDRIALGDLGVEGGLANGLGLFIAIERGSC